MIQAFLPVEELAELADSRLKIEWTNDEIIKEWIDSLKTSHTKLTDKVIIDACVYHSLLGNCALAEMRCTDNKYKEEVKKIRINLTERTRKIIGTNMCIIT